MVYFKLMCKTKCKCKVCNSRNAWILSPKSPIPVYCRKCYVEKVLTIKYLKYFCEKCGHKRNNCQISGTDGNTCFGCWFTQKNLSENLINHFYNYLNHSHNKTSWDISDFISDHFDFNFCSCCFVYSREHRC